MERLLILGATGSIGTSTLRVVEKNLDRFDVYALVAGSNSEKMLELCQQWHPTYAAMSDKNAALILEAALKEQGITTQVLAGDDEICRLSALDEIDTVMAAIVGAAGLLPTMAAVKKGKRILLANKEALVMSGQFFIDAAYEYGATILPVDSEHNAIFQCLTEKAQQNIGRCDLKESGISQILLTGSGGPFRYMELSEFENVTPKQAIAHPTWSMGPKISVDSATMMNKGLEYIEAKWLFNAAKGQIQVVIHPQSMIHSMVQYIDGAVLAELGEADMCTPIANAMAYPNRIASSVKPLDFTQIGSLTFLAPDKVRYPCLDLAIEACYQGQSATTALNAANEITVQAFLKGQIKFTDIARINRKVLEKKPCLTAESIEHLLEIDAQSRRLTSELLR